MHQVCVVRRICDDYDLCATCEEKPRRGIHDPTHFFIKLKRPAEKRVPEGNVLLPVSMKAFQCRYTYIILYKKSINMVVL